MKKKETKAQLLKKAAVARKEARILMESMAGMEGADAVERARHAQDLLDQARALQSKAEEPGR